MFCLRQFVACWIGCRGTRVEIVRIDSAVPLAHSLECCCSRGTARQTVAIAEDMSDASLSLSGFGAVQVWKRVNPVRRAVTLLRNMAGAGEVKFFTCLCRTSLLSAFERFFLDLCASSLVAALFESQWSALPTSAHS